MTTETSAAANEVEQPALNINDLSDAVKIIDLACEKGAFTGWTNIITVLNTRNRLQAFIQSMVAPQEAVQTPPVSPAANV